MNLGDAVYDALKLAPIDEALQRVAQQRDATKNAPAVVGDVIGAAVQEVLRGGAVPDVGADVLAEQHAAAALAEQQKAVDEILRRLQTQRHQVQRLHVDQALEVLAKAFERIRTHASNAFALLGKIADAESAIDAGLGEQWGQIKALAKELHRLRECQLDLITAAFDQPPPAVASATPVTALPKNDTIITFESYGSVRDFASTWRAAPRDERPWLAADRIAVLRWSCSESSTAWVPTSKQLRAALSDVKKAVERDRAQTRAERDEAGVKMRAPSERAIAAARDTSAAHDYNLSPRERAVRGR
jgi:hypothetical protein